jgi:hypothetical protein
MNSVEPGALSRNEAARFEYAVAQESVTPRAPFEAVSENIVVDRSHGVVYVVAPELVALDLTNGAVRWRRQDIQGYSLHRLGSALVVAGGTVQQPILWFVSSGASTPTIHQCALSLSLPAEANVVRLIPFDRSDVPHVYFASSAVYPPQGHPSARRWSDAVTCGVLELNLNTCSTQVRPLQNFLLDPPRDFGSTAPIEPDDCRYLMPDMAMPAVAASRIPAATATASPPLRLVRREVPNDSSCGRRNTVTLEAMDERSRVRWTHALPVEVSNAGCPPPP